MQQLSTSRGPLIDLGSLNRALDEKIIREQDGEDGSPEHEPGEVNEFNTSEGGAPTKSPDLPAHLHDPYFQKQNDGQGADSRDFDNASEDNDDG